MPPNLTAIIDRPRPDFSQLDRVLRRQGRPDWVPFYELFVNLPMQEALLGRKLPDRAATVEFYYRAGYDYVPVWPHLILPRGNLADTSTGYPIRDWATFEKHPWPTPDSVGFAEFETVARILPDGMKLIGQTGGIFETLEGLFGYEGLCFQLADDPALVEAVLTRLGELYESMYRGMAGAAHVGAVVISDDLGFKTQTLISPADLRKYILPWHKRLATIIHAQGKPCILHSCGQLAAIMDELIDDVGIDAKHSFEDAILPVAEAKKRYGERIAILGGFDVDRLCRSPEADVRTCTRRLIRDLGADGGYALGSGNSIADYVPVANYLAMLDEGWKSRRG